MEQTHELPMLAGIGSILRWCEELLVLASGPILTFGLGVGLVALLTDGQLLVSAPWLIYVWGAAMAAGVDGQLIGAAVKAGRAFRAQRWAHVAGYCVIIAAVGYVAYLAAIVFATVQAEGITTAQALARLGMDNTTWITERSAVAVALTILSGLLRYEPAKATAIETQEEREKRQAYELAIARHRAELRAVNAAGMRGMIAAGMGRVNPLDTPDDTPAIDARMDAHTADDTPPDDGGNGGHNTPGNRTRSRRNHPGLKAVPSGMWKRDELQRYAQVKHGVSVSDDEATRAVSTLGNHRKYGRSYIAPKAAVKAWVDRTYGAGNADTLAADRSA